jgi:Mg-chelatase subunit ChlD
MKKIIYPAAILFILMGYQNCSDVSFRSTPVSTKSCETILNTTNKNIRILFMVDDSGSTLQTDPMKRYRALAIQNFVAKYGSKTNFSYVFGDFEANNSFLYNPLTNDFGNANITTTNVVGTSSDLSNALTLYLSQTTSPNANTPYQVAFEALNGAISRDISATASFADKPNYAIVFMSDGQPNPSLSNNQIKNLVIDLKTSVLNSARLVSVSTVYFGPDNDDGAKSVLRDIASEGNGQFVDTNVSTDLTIESVISVPGEICTD